eukprot:TRINITY_DN3499_c0_g1_i1.p1 TRINITY_DN3499_c0_g1~~TRINITY_DN3499_c0_g1_i1.p1  ORF type:complete len:371 (+),score=70.89 TRINITY_DN3499_c0_g1_i1:75-1187(+)
MQCDNCQVFKLSEEYPETITSGCDHQVRWCYTCVLGILDANLKSSKTTKCIDPTCPNPVDRVALETLQSEYPFQFLVHHYGLPKEEPKMYTRSPVLDGQPMSIYVTTLDGRRNKYNVSSQLQIWSLKKMIEETIQVKPELQRLIFNKQELRRYVATQEDPATLSSYGIREGSEINLLIMMYQVKEEDHLKKVEFHLSWGFPNGRKDYLDGSCLTFNQGKLIEKVDYQRTRDSRGAIKHSGDRIDDRLKRGTHTITVSLDLLKDVDMLFFTLSSWNAKSLKAFSTPSVRIVEASSPDDVLSTYVLDGSSEQSEQALIMCCLVKGMKGRWYIYQVGKHSKGNAKRYDEIVNTIIAFITEGNLAKSRNEKEDE